MVRIASKKKNLKIDFPKIAKEWHPTKNFNILPDQVLSKTKKKYWWLCKKNHSYLTSVGHRTRKGRGTGCPYCAGRKLSIDNSLQAISPKIAKEWHLKKNKNLKPENVLNGTRKKVWWKCSKNHEYFASIANRSKKNRSTGCPFCTNKKLTKENNLLKKSPNIAKEWHPTKNGKLKPSDVVNGSSKKVWWLCPKGHSYNSIISGRTSIRAHGCARCSRQSSEPELRILSELRFLFKNIVSRHKSIAGEIDIFIPEIKLGIEHDGSYYHKDKDRIDRIKTKTLNKNFIKLIRVRHFPLNKMSKHDVVYKLKTLKKSDLNLILNNIYSLAKIKKDNKFSDYIKNKSFLNQKLYKKYLSYFPSPLPEHSLLKTNKKLSNEWDYEKNQPLRPEDFTASSDHKAWWKCNKGHNSYEAIIGNRTRVKSGCPFCSNRKASYTNNLEKNFPEIAKEFHPTKNKYSASEYTKSSGKIVWWKCSKNHEYRVSIDARTSKGRGCRICNRTIPSKEYNFLKLFPKIANQWHPTKNGPLKPQEILPGSNKKIWWRCTKGHQYITPISRRTQKNPSGCPFCTNKKLTKENNLLKKSPNIAKEWHPTKNGKLKPSDVVNGSSKKVWWLCFKKHEYNTSIAHRTDKKNPTGCPFCSNNKVSKDNNLEFLFPKIARQWHPSKNKKIKPNAIIPGSNKKYWWKCKLGHEYTTSPWQKTKKNKPIICPICSGRRVSKDNNLIKKFPKIGREWHDIKNEGRKPNEFTYGSHFNAWWKCKKNHEWKAQIKYRTSAQLNCPKCKLN